MGGPLKGAELNRSTFEQEAYAIFQVFEKLDYLFMEKQPVHVSTDHRNPVFVFAPLALEPALGGHIISKVQRWALFLSRFIYVIEHIDGCSNIFADILTRWTKNYRVEKLSTKAIYSFLDTLAQVVPSSEDIEWPNIEELRASQCNAEARPAGLSMCEDGLLRNTNRIWILNGNEIFKLRILITSHCGSMGHRGIHATESVLQEYFVWDSIAEDVAMSIQGCLQCIVMRTGEVVPRLLGQALHGESTNKVIHMDFLFMGAGEDGLKYILIVRDDASGYEWLFPAEFANSEVEAETFANGTQCSMGSSRWSQTKEHISKLS